MFCQMFVELELDSREERCVSDFERWHVSITGYFELASEKNKSSSSPFIQPPNKNSTTNLISIIGTHLY